MNSNDSDFDLLSVALVREYLSRKGYKMTLKQFDKESRQKDRSIQNRKVLAQEIGIIDLVIKNKERGLNAAKTFLEMIVNELLSLKQMNKSWMASQHKPTSPHTRTNSMDKFSISSSFNNTSSPIHNTKRDQIDIDLIPAANVNDIALNTSSCRLANLNLEGNDTPLSQDVLSSKRKNMVHQLMMLDNNKSPSRKALTASSNNILCRVNSPKKSAIDDNKGQRNSGRGRNDIEHVLEDFTFDELGEVESGISYEDELTYDVSDITLEQAVKLKVILLGSATQNFNIEWSQQGFEFCTHDLLKYGLVQEKGGPCGLLASVQAFILKHLFFVSNKKRLKSSKFQPNLNEQKMVLVNALVDIINSVSPKKSFIVVLPSRSSKFTRNREYKKDDLTEKLRLFHLKEHELKRFVNKNISHFMCSNGCILFLYSVVLSHGIENIRNTMDEPDGTLIGSHGYCTQEMVNLLLTGRPVSNVFDGVMELDSGGDHKFMLTGLKSTSEIGFLSLFEHYESCKVGDNYKNPTYPIWVVCSESHFSVLFSPIYLLSEDTSFDLYYYDGLARQDEEIRLTVNLHRARRRVAGVEELVPPLEHCICTKWKAASISWNGSEPIL